MLKEKSKYASFIPEMARIITPYTVYIYFDSNLLAPVFCFAELVLIGSWVLWTERHAPLHSMFRTTRKELNVPNLKSYCPDICCAPTHVHKNKGKDAIRPT